MSIVGRMKSRGLCARGVHSTSGQKIRPPASTSIQRPWVLSLTARPLRPNRKRVFPKRRLQIAVSQHSPASHHLKAEREAPLIGLWLMRVCPVDLHLPQHQRVPWSQGHVDPRPWPNAGSPRRPGKRGRMQEALASLLSRRAENRVLRVEGHHPGGVGAAGTRAAHDASRVVQRRVQRPAPIGVDDIERIIHAMVIQHNPEIEASAREGWVAVGSQPEFAVLVPVNEEA
eukprot:scaffold47213_cov270-Isochrysis_galbana.AAC.5